MFCFQSVKSYRGVIYAKLFAHCIWAFFSKREVPWEEPANAANHIIVISGWDRSLAVGAASQGLSCRQSLSLAKKASSASDRSTAPTHE
jgi:hypothetical protein